LARDTNRPLRRRTHHHPRIQIAGELERSLWRTLPRHSL